jgi:hypothetical protein
MINFNPKYYAEDVAEINRILNKLKIKYSEIPIN